MFGFLSKFLVISQQDYYKEMLSRKMGTIWGVQLISRMWCIIQTHWIHRKSMLHKTEALSTLSGVDNLKDGISR